jgi:hypothetical protein
VEQFVAVEFSLQFVFHSSENLTADDRITFKKATQGVCGAFSGSPSGGGGAGTAVEHGRQSFGEGSISVKILPTEIEERFL